MIAVMIMVAVAIVGIVAMFYSHVTRNDGQYGYDEEREERISI